MVASLQVVSGLPQPMTSAIDAVQQWKYKPYLLNGEPTEVETTININLVVDMQGMPQNVHVQRGVGMGLDEKAIQAVKRYRFKPAMEDGNPVPVALNIEVNFQSF